MKQYLLSEKTCKEIGIALGVTYLIFMGYAGYRAVHDPVIAAKKWEETIKEEACIFTGRQRLLNSSQGAYALSEYRCATGNVYWHYD